MSTHKYTYHLLKDQRKGGYYIRREWVYTYSVCFFWTKKVTRCEYLGRYRPIYGGLNSSSPLLPIPEWKPWPCEYSDKEFLMSLWDKYVESVKAKAEAEKGPDFVVLKELKIEL
jgi:hypothetical protein